ncbi:hypothetical protein BV22DRAFT_1130265 [Leucogyrophana mollusca]|uniref:Uncharacterized protein n=1 Tax=Leucogyrophana mollusca TaxID=85980 RepID=A0ACB8BEE1_9AGAM|nr:hypothetical protein BV22DRAFT_1130265 [Leucogyrophana mollusca]
MDFVAYRALIKRHLNHNGSQTGDSYHQSFSKHTLVSIAVDSLNKHFEVSQAAELIPNARFISLSILVDRRYLFNNIVPYLLTDRPSLTHLRLCWPPLGRSFSCAMTNVVISSVTHLHIPRHPYASLNAVLALFPCVTHLRLGTPCFLKDLVPYMTAVKMLVLDAPPNYSIHSPNHSIAGPCFPSSVPLWNVSAALENGLLQAENDTPNKLVINAGVEDSDECTILELALSCRKRGIAFECRRLYPAYSPRPALEKERWNYGAWI